jgi:rhomboid family GlyGly-CTERM serine protease
VPSSAEAGGRAWLGLCAVAAAGAGVAWWLPTLAMDWQPALAWSEPWRWWTAAWVHWSPLHLAANLAGCAVLAALGTAAGPPPRVALAWALAWAPTHLALLARPALAHYGGLSGVLHAGVASLAVWLLWAGRGRRRAIGGALGAGLALKVGLERPWAEPLAHPAGWDIAVVPLVHASGAVCGALCSLALLALPGRGR